MKKLILMAAFVLILSPITMASGPEKIGVVDFKQIIDNSKSGKAMQVKVREKGELLKTELENAQSELKSLQDQFKKEAALWSEEKKNEKERTFKVKVSALNQLKLTTRNEFNEFKNRLIKELKADFLKSVEKTAEKKGYLLIIEKRTGEIFYMDPSASLTDELLQIYDKATK